MRTRRSWRNQERLFRYLFEPKKVKVEIVQQPVCRNCYYWPERNARDRATCGLKKTKVNSRSTCESYITRAEWVKNFLAQKEAASKLTKTTKEQT